ncbi:MAG: hypothetical protein AB1898_32790 [Acidobacteriota bacterium]
MNQLRKPPAYFKGLYEDSSFWSCCGLDGLSIVFDLPLDSIRSLTEEQKRAILHLLGYLASGEDCDLLARVVALQEVPAEERFHALVDLSFGLLPELGKDSST